MGLGDIFKFHKKAKPEEQIHFENVFPELQPPPHTSNRKYNDSDIDVDINNQIYEKVLAENKKYNNDYVKVMGYACCCPECAKYRDRIYCISGKDKRFPKLPEFIKNYSWHCGLIMSIFALEVNYMNLYDGTSIFEIPDLIKISNRPFIDDRNSDEIERYNNVLAKNKQEYIDEINKRQAKSEYERILKVLPDVAPKNQGGYLRMKKLNSENFQKLAEKAKTSNIEIKDIITENDLDN